LLKRERGTNLSRISTKRALVFLYAATAVSYLSKARKTCPTIFCIVAGDFDEPMPPGITDGYPLIARNAKQRCPGLIQSGHQDVTPAIGLFATSMERTFAGGVRHVQG
jgi:hypothetical protein